MAKHLLMCRSYYVTCIDCNQTFEGNAWESHTRCVSEAQKYQGALFQAKESSNKGQKKQESWIDRVMEKIESPGMSPQLKGLLQRLLGFDNIPRKQKPFANFVKNSLKIWNDKQIGEMWSVIAEANAAPKAGGAAATAAPAQQAGGGDAKPKWGGWKRVLDEELRAAGGELEWKRLRTALVSRHRSSGEAFEGSDEDLGCAALASIPDAYLSKSDALVRLPGA